MAQPLSLTAFDGVRALASIAVIVGHFATFWSPIPSVLETPSAGQPVDPNRYVSTPDNPFPIYGLDYLSAVTLFFLISGFVLVHTYNRPPSGSLSVPVAEPWQPFSTYAELRTFFWKRLGRLAPVYYLALALGAPAGYVYSTLFSFIGSVVTQVLWLQSLVIIFNSINGPLWTVSAFAFCYAFFPVCLRAFRRFSTIQLFWATLMVSGVALVEMPITLLRAGPEALIVIHILAPARLPHFLLGMLAALLAQRIREGQDMLQFCMCMPARIVVDLLSVLFLLSLAGGFTLAATTKSFGPYSLYQYAAEFMLAPLYAIWLAAMSLSDGRDLTSRVLTLPPLAWLGKVSYSVYCLHWPVIGWSAWALAARGVSADAVPGRFLDGVGGWFTFPPYAIIPLLALCIAVGAASYYVLEAPARATVRPKQQPRVQDWAAAGGTA